MKRVKRKGTCLFLCYKTKRFLCFYDMQVTSTDMFVLSQEHEVRLMKALVPQLHGLLPGPSVLTPSVESPRDGGEAGGTAYPGKSQR